MFLFSYCTVCDFKREKKTQRARLRDKLFSQRERNVLAITELKFLSRQLCL